MARITRTLGYRVDERTLEKFKQLCGFEGLRPGQALERIMEAANEEGSLLRFLHVEKGPTIHDEAITAEARILLSYLARDQHWTWRGDREVSVPGKLLELLPKLREEGLIREVEEALKKNALKE